MRNGVTFPFMVVRGSVLEVSTLSDFSCEALYDADSICALLVDFALTEAGYTVVRLLQSFPTIKLPEGEVVELVGVEQQVTTLVVSIKEGCKVVVN
jgi:hypothetical protein